MSYITRKSYDEIKSKLEQLVMVKRVEIAEKIRVAAVRTIRAGKIERLN